MTSSSTTTHRARLARAVASVGVIAAGLLALVTTSARADGSVAVSITQATPATQPSGSSFHYELAYSCSGVEDDGCVAPSIRIPMGAGAPYVATVSGPDVATHSMDGTTLVVSLNDLTSGDSGTAVLTLRTPNGTTPNGASWTLQPTITSGTSTATAPAPVTGTATAANPLAWVRKDSLPTSARPGGEVRHVIEYQCGNGTFDSGRADLAEVVVEDPLPAGLTYVSSTAGGTYDAATRTVRWTRTGADIGALCATGSGNVPPLEVVTTVDAGVADGTVLTNEATVVGTPFAGANVAPVTLTDDAQTTVLDQPVPGATLRKYPLGPLRSDGLAPNASTWGDATYAGRWGRGWTPGTGEVTSVTGAVDRGLVEMGYEVYVNFDDPGAQVAITDPVPCDDHTTGPGGTVYVAAPSGLCQNPAFNPTFLTVYTSSYLAPRPQGVPGDYQPVAVLADGSEVSLPAANCGVSTDRVNGNESCTYAVPASAVGRVAEVRFPRDGRMTDRTTFFTMGGYASAGHEAGDLLRNRAHATTWLGDRQVGEADTPVADVTILDRTQLGISKSVVGSNADSVRFDLSVRYVTPTAPEHDLVVADLLPAGFTLTPGSVAVKVTGGPTIPVAPQVVADPAGSDRQLVRLVIPRDRLDELLGGGPGALSFSAQLPTSADVAGAYTNTAGVYTAPGTAGLSPRCTRGTAVPTDPQDLDGVAASQQHCEATVSGTVAIDPASTAFRVTKEVRGNGDDGFRSFPSVGRITTDGGDAEYRLTWRNRGGQALSDPVLYDLLPHPGDTGIVAATRNEPRGSAFAPRLTAIGTLPAGVAVEYSTATNPCRPEVLPDAQNPGCTDDWTGTAPADLATVTALRFRATGSYPAGSTVAVTFTMATPRVDEADVAWNTAAGTARYGTSTLSPAEAPKVGIASDDFSQLRFAKTVDQAEARRGDLLTYTVDVRNTGSLPISDVVVTDTLPDGVRLSSATGGGTATGSTVRWDVATLAAGERLTFTVYAVVEADAPAGTLVNRLTATGGDDTVPPLVLHPCADDATSSCATSELGEVPAITVDKAVDRSRAAPGDLLTYTIELANTSGSDGSVRLFDLLPAGVTFESASDGGVFFANPLGDGRDIVQWPEPLAVEAGGSRSVTVTVRVGDDAEATTRNCASAGGEDATVVTHERAEEGVFGPATCASTEVGEPTPSTTTTSSTTPPTSPTTSTTMPTTTSSTSPTTPSTSPTTPSTPTSSVTTPPSGGRPGPASSARPTASRAGSLSRTGTSVLGLVVLGTVLILAGAALSSRRRARSGA